MPLRLQATEDDVYHLMDLKEQYFIMTAICSVAEGISERILFHIPEKMLGSCIFVYCTGIKSIKYVLMHSKTWLTVGQYNLMIDCVLGIILIAEIFMIYASFV